MTVKEAAELYVSRGWQFVPLLPNTKEIHVKDWLTKIFAPSVLGPRDNLGLKLVNGMTDVDADALEAVACVSVFLPPTGTIYGRPSKLLSHWLYDTNTGKSVRFEDLANTDPNKKSTLIEIRVDHQSMAPPSVHPSGEPLSWHVFEQPAVVEAKILYRAVQLVATCAMISRHYNAPGTRHEWGLALSGTLRGFGLTSDECEKIFTAAAAWAQDSKLADRLREVSTTYAIPDGSPVVGVKRLAELTSDKFVMSLRKIWGDDAAGKQNLALEQLNEKHALLFQQSGQLVLLTECVEDGLHQLRFSQPSVMPQLYPQRVQIGINPKSGAPIYKPLGAAWLIHPKRRMYSGIEVAPRAGNPGYYNMWRGFTVEPKKDDWSLFREHLYTVCEDDEDSVRYVYAWLAETVQYPDRQIGIAPTFKGKQGTGKSTFVKWFGGLFGSHFLHLDSEHRLLGNFNAHLHNAIFIFADEAVWAGGKQGLGALKRLITEDTLAIERKGLDVINVKNMIHMMVASNEDWVVPASFDNRRFAIFRVSDRHRNDAKFFGAVADELFNRGGLSALLYDLLEAQLINLRDIPETAELAEQKKYTMPPKIMWWYEMLVEGTLWDSAIARSHDSFYVDPNELYRQYVETLRVSERSMSLGMKGALGRQLRKLLPEPYPFYEMTNNARHWVFPSLEACRAFFNENYMQGEWDSVVQSEDVPF